jgi:hypothetical protein
VKVGLGRFPGYLLALDAEREGPPDDVVFGFGPGRLLVLDAEREGPPVEASLGFGPGRLLVGDVKRDEVPEEASLGFGLGRLFVLDAQRDGVLGDGSLGIFSVCVLTWCTGLEGAAEISDRCRRSFASSSVRYRVFPGSSFPRFNGPN